MAPTAGTVVERGMKIHAEVDSNIKTLILERLSDFLDELYSIYDLNQAVKRADITLTADTETVSMETDLLRLSSIVYDNPWFGYEPVILNAQEYLRIQSLYSTTKVNPPEFVFPDYPNRVFRFQAIPTAGLTGTVSYYPQFADMTTSTDLAFFPMTSLLVNFCYLEYCDYDQVEPRPSKLAAFERLMRQLPMKYNEGKDAPSLSDRFFKYVELSND